MLTTIEKVLPSVAEPGAITELRAQAEAITIAATAAAIVERDRNDIRAAADLTLAAIDAASLS